MAFIDDYRALLDEQYRQVRCALVGLPLEAIDWSSDQIRNPLGALTRHVIGSEGYWLGEVIGGEPQERDRPAEFSSRGLSEVDLLGRLEERDARIGPALSSLSTAQLDDPREVGLGESMRRVSVAWVLLHVLEHTAYHAGQMSVIRRLWLERESEQRS